VDIELRNVPQGRYTFHVHDYPVSDDGVGQVVSKVVFLWVLNAYKTYTPPPALFPYNP